MLWFLPYVADFRRPHIDKHRIAYTRSETPLRLIFFDHHSSNFDLKFIKHFIIHTINGNGRLRVPSAMVVVIVTVATLILIFSYEKLPSPFARLKLMIECVI